MKNKLTDLNNHLFEAIERLNDNDVCKDVESTANEINRANSMSNIAQQILNLHGIELKAVEMLAKYGKKEITEENFPETIFTQKKLSPKLEAIKEKYKKGIPLKDLEQLSEEFLPYDN